MTKSVAFSVRSIRALAFSVCASKGVILFTKTAYLGIDLGAQVVYFVCMAGRMEDALHDALQELEVRAAVESVFPFSMLAQFLTLAAADRELQLNELPYIAVGICYYNQVYGVSQGPTLSAVLQGCEDRSLSLAKQCSECISQISRTLQKYSGGLLG
jgi:hypothetical protein